MHRSIVADLSHLVATSSSSSVRFCCRATSARLIKSSTTAKVICSSQYPRTTLSMHGFRTMAKGLVHMRVTTGQSGRSMSMVSHFGFYHTSGCVGSRSLISLSFFPSHVCSYINTSHYWICRQHFEVVGSCNRQRALPVGVPDCNQTGCLVRGFEPDSRSHRS